MQKATLLGKCLLALRALQRTAPVRAYARSLESHPLPTKCATSGALMVVSDVMRQKLERRDADDAEPFRWDVARYEGGAAHGSEIDACAQRVLD